MSSNEKYLKKNKVVIFNNIRKKIGFIILKRKIKAIKRKVVYHNFATASTIGIVFTKIDDKTHNEIKKFIKELQASKIKVSALGYTHKEIIQQGEQYIEGVSYFSAKDLTWYFAPKKEIITDFANTPFDLLINVNGEKTYPLKFITGLSLAKCKIGLANSQPDFLDISLKLKEGSPISASIEQFKHYLSVLKTGIYA